jgi:small subunit ribosomal protein S4
MKLGPKYKICKRLGSPIFEKCQTQQFQISSSKRATGKKMKRAGSEYQKQLIEKQKLRLLYGLTEKQFSNYVRQALENNTNPQEILFQLLEERLDSVIYRMGLAKTRRMARQVVSHGHVTVNGRKVTVPSYHVKPGDAIAVRDGSRGSVLFEAMTDRLQEYNAPSWIQFDPKTLQGTLKNQPVFANQDVPVDIKAVFEYYTR